MDKKKMTGNNKDRIKLHFIIAFPDKDLGKWKGEICDSFWSRKLAEDYIKHPPPEYRDYFLILATEEGGPKQQD
jgi:hypothetical protein